MRVLCIYPCTVSIAEKIARVHELINQAAWRARRSPGEIALMAVTKTVEPGQIREAYAAGIRHFGENRVQEFERKRSELADLRDAEFHLIGHLQSNKANKAVDLFNAVDSLDSVAVASKLNSAAAKLALLLRKEKKRTPPPKPPLIKREETLSPSP